MMTLDEFLKVIRYRSLKLIIYSNDCFVLYEGTLGEYMTSVFRQKNSNQEIFHVFPHKNELEINLFLRRDQI